MSHDTLEVSRTRVSIETTFGADATSDVASNFDDIRIKPTQAMREPMMAPDETAVQRFYQRRNDVIGPKRGSVPLEAYWTGMNQTLDVSTSPTQTEQSKVFEHALGGYQSDQGSTCASGEAADGAVVATGHGTRFAENTMVGVINSGVVYPRIIKTISTDTLTWWPNLPSAPATSSAVYNSQTNYYKSTTEKWMQMLCEGNLDRGDIWLVRGGALHDFKLKLERGGLLTWSGTVRGAVYDHDDEITTPQGGSAIAAASFTDTGPKWGMEGGLHFGPTSSGTLTLVECVQIEVNFDVRWLETPKHSGVAGIGGWDRERPRAEVSLTLLTNAASGNYEVYEDAMHAETDYGFLFWLGSEVGNILAIGGTTGQITKVEPTTFNSRKAQKVTLMMRENSLSTGGTTPTSENAGSPLIIAQV